MFLQEEYFRRHNIEDVPLVNHILDGALFIKGGDASPYIVVTIKWEDNNLHPGKYYINFLSPIHNGYNRGRYFGKLCDPKELEWEEYIPFFLKWGKDGSLQTVIGEQEAALASWEIFLHCCDNWLAEYAESSFTKLIWKTVNPELLVEQRMEAYQEIMLYITTEHPSLYKSYRYEMLPYVQKYSHWLGQLVKRFSLEK